MANHDSISALKELISIQDAQAILLDDMTQIPAEWIGLAEASGRILRAPVMADRPSPPFDRVMMDGIAIRFTAGKSHYQLQGTQPAGRPALHLLQDDDCIEVMTGAVLPTGADTIVPVEELIVTSEHVRLRDGYVPQLGQFIHRCGSDAATGAILLPAGQRLGPAELAVCASVGATQLECSRLPRITLLSTGDEVVAPSTTPTHYQIRSSHPSALSALITGSQLGTVTHHHLPDDPTATRLAIQQALAHSDFLLLTGGISMGKFDWVAPTLTELVGQPRFHGVAQRPGKPLGFWSNDHAPPVLALPGNPVSVMATASVYLMPALRKMAGLADVAQLAILSHDFYWQPSLGGLLPYRWQHGMIQLMPPANSGDYAALTGTAGFAHLPKGGRHFPANTPLTLYPFT